ncbi:MAG: hypothetical protein V3W34_02180 [Phycisphaerae bacterium]
MSETTMQQLFIILYKYKSPGEKKPGPVRQFRIYADDLEEARRQAQRYANYPNIELIEVKPA